MGVILFGSALNSVNYNDLDICLVFFPQVKESVNAFDYILKSSEICDVSVLAELPVYIQKEVLKGKVLINKDYNTLFDIYIDILREWDDFHKRYWIYLEMVKAGL